MLPQPFIDFLPKVLRNADIATILSNKADEHITEWKESVDKLSQLVRSDECPSNLLNELGYTINANIIDGDSDQVKRIKIATAIQGHKNRCLWNDDVKQKIDAIAGGDSQIIYPGDTGQWIILGGESDDTDNYWATLGTDETATTGDEGLGIDILGEGNEGEISGNVYIDTDNDSLTIEELDLIEIALNDSLATYYMIYLGYINVSGQFIQYRTIG